MAEALAGQGGRVVLAARSEERSRPVLETIRSRHPASDPQFLQIDLSDLASVRRAAEGRITRTVEQRTAEDHLTRADLLRDDDHRVADPGEDGT